MARLKFFAQSLKHFYEIGTFIPTSKHTSNKIAKEIIGTGKNIVEFGPGTGVITRKLLEYLPESGNLTCFELNTQFCSYLKEIIDPRLKVINENAKSLEKYVKEPDCIVSSLPLALMEYKDRDKILNLSSRAKKYIQIQYNPCSAKIYRRHFDEVKLKISLLNLPMAIIYVCTNNP